MSTNKTTAPSWLSEAIFYQIYPQSFCDSNGDGIGDIPGIIGKLDYLKELGVTALWLNPCFDSPFQDAGYDVSDFRKVAPRYGANKDLVELFEKAHERGMKVCLDLVAGHTSVEHPWFKESCKPERNEYSDYYIWTKGWDSARESGLRFINGYADRDGCYAINFFYSQPALNYGFQNPDPKYPWQQPIDAQGPRKVRQELKDIMKFWLDLGADGFRVDMAPSLIKNDPDRVGVTALWQEFRKWLDKDYPEAVLVAEWGNPSQAIAAGYHIDFMIHSGVPGYPSLFFKKNIFRNYADNPPVFFSKEGKGDVTEFVGEYLKQLTRTQGLGYISIPSANHDFQRPNWDRDEDELEVIFTFLLTWPGVPIIYYGDEIGMRYHPKLPSKEGGFARTGTRTPMQWDDSTNAGFSTAATQSLYLPIDPATDRPSVAKQADDPNSLLSQVKQLVKLRKDNPALRADGQLNILHARRNQYPLIYERVSGETRFIIVVNPANRSTDTEILYNLPGDRQPEKIFNSRNVEIKRIKGHLKISTAACSAGIFRINAE